ncbi:MAG: Calx-beta domain-containing protein, partial [bacterium]
GEDELADLQLHVDQLNLYSPAKFFVHVGDIKSGDELCDETRYVNVANILKSCQIPVFMLPGDNEWGDCPDPALAWQYWDSNFMEFDDNFCKTFTVERQTVRPEHWAFPVDGVLFMGMNLPNQEETGSGIRVQDAADWLVEKLADYGTQVRALVVFGHAFDGGDRDVFFDQLQASAIAFGKPVLYVMGDLHDWEQDNPFPLAPNITRIVVNQGGYEDPVQITVTTDPLAPWTIVRDPWAGNPQPITRPGCGGGGVIISDVYVNEPDSSTDPASFTISLSGGDGRQVTVVWQTAPGTASAGTDYVTKSGILTLSGTTPSRTITVSVKGDLVWEPDETFYVNLSNPTNEGRLVDPQGACRIVNDDPLPYYDVSLTKVGQGDILLDPSGTTHALNTVVTATAVFDSGWAFDGWSGVLTGTQNPNDFVVLSDTVLVATFSPNASPEAVADQFPTNEDDPLVVATPGVLANDFDPDLHYPLAAQIMTPPAHGVLQLAGDGSFTYAPA